MNAKQRAMAIFVLVTILATSGCAFAQSLAPTPVPTSTATVNPTLTPTSTPYPSPSATATSAPADWKGIPIMPNATAGQEFMGDYQFTTKASAEEINTYYKSEMAALGWELRPDMMASIPTDLAFMKGNTYVFFKIDPAGNENIVMIHLVQQ